MIPVGRMLHEQLKSLLEKNRLPDSESESSDSDIDEIVNMIKHQRIRKQIRKRQAQRKVSEENVYHPTSQEQLSLSAIANHIFD